MSDPTWFIEDDYLASKLAQLKAAGQGTLYNHIDQVRVAIEGIGLTPFEHFSQFSADEDTSPHALFNAYEYLTAKARSLNDAGHAGGPWTIQMVSDAFKANGLSAWQHFQQFGWKEGVNPSNRFDIGAYLQAKVAQLQQALPDETWTVARVTAAFEANGYDPITHLEVAGRAEGVPVSPVRADRWVEDDPRDAGSHFILTTAASELIIGTPLNDTVLAESVAALQNGHRVLDVSSTDRDVLRVIAAEMVALDDGLGHRTQVSGFEVLDVTWQDYVDAEVDLAGFAGLRDVRLAVEQVGNLGHATISNVDGQSVLMGAGVTGTVSVTSRDHAAAGGTLYTGLATAAVFDTGLSAGTDSTGTATVVGGEAVTVIHVSQDAARPVFETAVVKAGASTTQIAASARHVDITTSAATTRVDATIGVVVGNTTVMIDATEVAAQAEIRLTGSVTDPIITTSVDHAVLKLGNDVTLGVSEFEHSNDRLTLEVAAGKTVTWLGTGAQDRAPRVTIEGEGDVTLVGASSLFVAANIYKANAGLLTVSTNNVMGGYALLDTRGIQADLFTLTTAATGNDPIAGVSGASFASWWMKNGQKAVVTAAVPTANLHVRNMSNSGEQDAQVVLVSESLGRLFTQTVNALDLTAAHEDGLTINSLEAAGTQVKLTAAADVTVRKAAFSALDASAVTGKLVLGSDSAVLPATVMGAQGGSTVTFQSAGGAQNAVFVGQAGDDHLTVGLAPVGTRALFTLGEGDNSVSLHDLTGPFAGQAGAIVHVTAGSGDDTVELMPLSSVLAGSSLILELGGGTNTLQLGNLSVINSGANVLLGGVSVLALTGGALIAAEHLTAPGLVLKGVGVTASTLTVQGDALQSSTIDLSSWSVNQSQSEGARVLIEGGAAADRLTGTAWGDFLVGGGGDDVLEGGDGADTFILGTVGQEGVDHILDFNVSQGDVIRIGPSTSATALSLTDLGILPQGTGAGEYADLDDVLAAFALGGGHETTALAAYQFAYASKDYLLIDNGDAGYLASKDTLVEITGFVGTITADQLYNH